MSKPINKILFYGFVIAFVLSSLFPFYWIFITSLKTSAEASQITSGFWPSKLSFSAYNTVFTQDNFLQPLLNSAFVSLATTVLSLITSVLAAYSLARLGIKGKGLILGFILVAGFFPIIAMVGPLFLVFRTLGLLDSFTSLIFTYLIYTLPISTWLLTNFFSQIPKDLEEAAMVDGASRLQALWKIVIPIAVPGIFTAAILSFILAWNDFTFALSFISSPSHFTAPLAIVNLGQSQFQVFYNRIDAAVVVTTLPIALLVLLAQKKIISGLTAGAVK